MLSGSGISAESGLKTFRGAGGLWEGHRVEDVASPDAWKRDPELVMEFYNQRRKQLMEVEPNRAHHRIAELEKHFKVVVVTQNVDDLHERAGSGNIIHLHGELMKSRSEKDPNLIYEMDHWELRLGQKAEDGAQLRPHIVWFGEMVPMIEVAAREVMTADHLLVIGTSLQVYPAAGLVNFSKEDCQITLIDPEDVMVSGRRVEHYKTSATVGMDQFFAANGL